MKIKVFILLLFVIFLLTGCMLDPYKNTSYGEKVIDSWFSYVNENGDDLGLIRKKIENIYEIESRECSFIKKIANKYIYKCNIKYKEIGETIIPLSKNKEIQVYALFILNKDGTYNYKVYNSLYKDEIWKLDEELLGGNNE